MKKRVLAALVMIAIAFAILVAGNMVLYVALTLLNIASCYEVLSSFSLRTRKTKGLFCYLMLPAILMPLVNTFWANAGGAIFVGYIIIAFLLMLLYNNKVGVNTYITALAMVTMLSFFLSFAYKVERLDNGKFLIWMVLVGACFTDTFALFGGKFFGKHKLAPKISPKKTIEGAIAGTLGGILMMIAYGAILNAVLNVNMSYVLLGVLGLLTAFTAQIGDLTLSAIKRHNNIKDYGDLIPGHGGILDRMDSIIFTAPLVYYFIIYTNLLG